MKKNKVIVGALLGFALFFLTLGKIGLTAVQAINDPVFGKSGTSNFYENNFLKNDPLELIRAINNPETNSSVVQNGGFNLTGTSSWNATDLRNDVKLNWGRPANLSGGYRVERSTNETFSDGKEIGANYGKKINILNVAPKPAADNHWFYSWMKMQNSANTGPIDRGLFNITTVWIRDYNANPGMLKKSDGTYKYDAIFFGAADWNSNNYAREDQDLNEASYQATKAFGDTGRAVTFGHDTIEGAAFPGVSVGPYHSYFNRFASRLGLKVAANYRPIGSDRLKIAIPGSLTEQPYFLDPTHVYSISKSHSWCSYYQYDSGAIRWIKYDESALNFPDGDKFVTYEKDGSGRVIADNNWYLVSKNNYAQIQTGHTSGQCTTQEAEIIFNMIYYTSSLITGLNGQDILAKDLTSPSLPSVSKTSENSTEVDLQIDTLDQPTNYYYRTRADTAAGNLYSDVIKMPVLSGIKGYIYEIDNSATSSPQVIKDPATGQVTNINLFPVSGNTEANLALSRAGTIGRYLHVVAIDNNNNVSAKQTVDLRQYIWWKYDAHVLTIYQHELNADTDSLGTKTDYSGGNYASWPWLVYTPEINQVVIDPGVTIKGSASGLFADCSNLKRIQGLTNINSSLMTNMDHFLYNCLALEAVDFSSFDTNSVISMANLFNRDRGLEEIKFGPNFITKNVTNFSRTFEGCLALKTINLTTFNTAKATTMEAMFNQCEALTSLDVSNFQTAQVKFMGWMFEDCKLLKAIDVSRFDTSSLLKTFRMFKDCTSLTQLDLHTFDSSKILDQPGGNPDSSLRQMLLNTPNLWKLTLGSKTNLNSIYGDVGLADPIDRTRINDPNLPAGYFYCTDSRWREVGLGSDHDPQGSVKSAAMIINESATRNDLRTYVWDQTGKCTFTVPTAIDFGTASDFANQKSYQSTAQNLRVTDNRSARKQKKWHIDAQTTKLVKVGTTQEISGNPLSFIDSTNQVIQLNSTATAIAEKAIPGQLYEDDWTIPWKLQFKAASKDIPVSGHYEGKIVFTLTEVSGI